MSLKTHFFTGYVELRSMELTQQYKKHDDIFDSNLVFQGKTG